MAAACVEGGSDLQGGGQDAGAARPDAAITTVTDAGFEFTADSGVAEPPVFGSLTCAAESPRIVDVDNASAVRVDADNLVRLPGTRPRPTNAGPPEFARRGDSAVIMRGCEFEGPQPDCREGAVVIQGDLATWHAPEFATGQRLFPFIAGDGTVWLADSGNALMIVDGEVRQRFTTVGRFALSEGPSGTTLVARDFPSPIEVWGRNRQEVVVPSPEDAVRWAVRGRDVHIVSRAGERSRLRIVRGEPENDTVLVVEADIIRNQAASADRAGAPLPDGARWYCVEDEAGGRFELIDRMGERLDGIESPNGECGNTRLVGSIHTGLVVGETRIEDDVTTALYVAQGGQGLVTVGTIQARDWQVLRGPSGLFLMTVDDDRTHSIYLLTPNQPPTLIHSAAADWVVIEGDETRLAVLWRESRPSLPPMTSFMFDLPTMPGPASLVVPGFVAIPNEDAFGPEDAYWVIVHSDETTGPWLTSLVDGQVGTRVSNTDSYTAVWRPGGSLVSLRRRDPDGPGFYRFDGQSIERVRTGWSLEPVALRRDDSPVDWVGYQDFLEETKTLARWDGQTLVDHRTELEAIEVEQDARRRRWIVTRPAEGLAHIEWIEGSTLTEAVPPSEFFVALAEADESPMNGFLRRGEAGGPICMCRLYAADPGCIGAPSGAVIEEVLSATGRPGPVAMVTFDGQPYLWVPTFGSAAVD